MNDFHIRFNSWYFTEGSKYPQVCGIAISIRTDGVEFSSDLLFAQSFIQTFRDCSKLTSYNKYYLLIHAPQGFFQLPSETHAFFCLFTFFCLQVVVC